MAGNDSSVSPYLLRPLRTLEQVLGGPSRAVEPRSERVEGRQTGDELRARAMANIGPSQARQPTELP
jgi:hypothetical protein